MRSVGLRMSACGPKADIRSDTLDVYFWPIADIARVRHEVR